MNWILTLALAGCGASEVYTSSALSFDRDQESEDSEGCQACLIPRLSLCPDGRAVYIASDVIDGAGYQLVGDEVVFEVDYFPEVRLDGDGLVEPNGGRWLSVPHDGDCNSE